MQRRHKLRTTKSGLSIVQFVALIRIPLAHLWRTDKRLRRGRRAHSIEIDSLYIVFFCGFNLCSRVLCEWPCSGRALWRTGPIM